MSDSESISESEGHIDESLKKIHHYVEQIAHDAKHIYSKALNLHQLIEYPEMDIWAQSFKLHERARGWAKRHMVASKCSLWEVNKTLLETAKKDGRIQNGKVQLTEMEASILNLSHTEQVLIWHLLSKLHRFFL